MSLLLAALCVAACATVSAEPASSWRHAENGRTYQVADQFGLDKLNYKVHWDSFELDETADSGRSVISGTTYLRSCDCAASQRPVVFLFNGGLETF